MEIFHRICPIDKFFISLNECLEYIFVGGTLETHTSITKQSHPESIREHQPEASELCQIIVDKENNTKNILIRNLTQRNILDTNVSETNNANISKQKKKNNVKYPLKVDGQYMDHQLSKDSDEEWDDLKKYNEVFDDWEII